MIELPTSPAAACPACGGAVACGDICTQLASSADNCGACGGFAAQKRAAMGLSYADDIAAFTMLHEVGHNHGRSHAPCAPGGGITGVDPNYPQPNGAIGVYGYNALGDQLIPPNFTDLMGYCNNQ